VSDAPIIARTPSPPYWAVIFTSVRTPDDEAGYAAMAAAMESLSAGQPGFLGIESARNAEGLGITVSYWASEEAMRAWKHVAAHAAAQRRGRERWYADYTTRIARVERDYTLATSPRDGL
jgi:heme-degrading monooxygenase HmoA